MAPDSLHDVPRGEAGQTARAAPPRGSTLGRAVEIAARILGYLAWLFAWRMGLAGFG